MALPVVPNFHYFSFVFLSIKCDSVYGDSPCLCSGGHTGPRCEYTNGDYSTVVAANELSVATTGSTTSGSGTNDNDISDIDNSATTSSGGAGGGCSLNCRHGTCVVGQQDLTNEYQFWENPSTTEHCNCPDDWDGPFCEIPRVQCGDNHCFYGATCLEDVVDGKSLHHCDCNTAATATDSYAGRFCQYPATIYCTKDSTQNGHLFCTNNGTVCWGLQLSSIITSDSNWINFWCLEAYSSLYAFVLPFTFI